MFTRTLKENGFSLIEILVGSSIITVSLIGMIIAFQSVADLERKNTKTTQAVFLAEEALEAVRALRQDDWSNISNLSSGTNYYLTNVAGSWTLSTTQTLIDNLFDRQITVNQVYRDGNNKIADAGTLDPNTIRVDVNVSWSQNGGEQSVELKTYLTNIFSG